MLAQGMLSAPTLLVGFPVVVRTVSKEMVSNVQVGSVFVVHSTHYKLHGMPGISYLGINN